MKIKPLIEKGRVSHYFPSYGVSSEFYERGDYPGISLYSSSEKGVDGNCYWKILSINNPEGLGKAFVKEFTGLEVLGLYALTGSGDYKELSNIIKDTPKLTLIEDPAKFKGSFKHLCLEIKNYYINEDGETVTEHFLISSDTLKSAELKSFYLSLLKNGVKREGADQAVKEVRRQAYIEKCKAIVKGRKEFSKSYKNYKASSLRRKSGEMNEPEKETDSKVC